MVVTCCDRCKVELDQGRGHTKHVMHKAVMVDVMDVTDYLIRESFNYDLCDDCYYSLGQWLDAMAG